MSTLANQIKPGDRVLVEGVWHSQYEANVIAVAGPKVKIRQRRWLPSYWVDAIKCTKVELR